MYFSLKNGFGVIFKAPSPNAATLSHLIRREQGVGVRLLQIFPLSRRNSFAEALKYMKFNFNKNLREVIIPSRIFLFSLIYVFVRVLRIKDTPLNHI